MEIDLDKLAQGEHEIDKRKRDVIERGTLRLSDLIAPDSIENTPRYTKIGDRYVRTISLVGFPRQAYIGWLNRLYYYPANIDISQHITPVPTETAIKMLSRKASQYISTRILDQKKGRLTDSSVDLALEDASKLRDQLQRGDERLFYTTIYINVAAEKEEELDEIVRSIESECGNMGLLTRPATFQQDLGFLSTLPIAQDRLRMRRNFTTNSLATTMPFVSAELTDTNGDPIFYGVNMVNSSLVLFDRFSLPNYNSVVLAMSGYGKSFFVKLETLKYLAMGVDIMIIDPQGEYKKLADLIGGTYIKLSSASEQHINPMDIDSVEQEERGKNFLTTKILDVYNIIELMTERKLEPKEKKVLLDAIKDTYEKFGITRDSKTVTENNFEEGEYFTFEGKTKRMPTLRDLEGTLRAAGPVGIDIADSLIQYTTDYLNTFSYETNVDTNSRFIVFDISDMEKELTEVALFICLEFIWNKIKKEKDKKRLLIVDEAINLLRHKGSAGYLERVARTARKFNAGMTIISQNAKDFLENGGEAITKNASMQVLLKQSDRDIEDVGEMFGLSESEKLILRTSAPGEALIFAGGKHTAVQIHAEKWEFELCKTDKNWKN